MQNQISDETVNTKQKILRAAAKVINTSGAIALTLEAVAKEAKISKGGLLYHFPNKNALMEGINDYLLRSFVDEVEFAASEDHCEKGKWTRAYTKVTFNQLGSEIDMNIAFLAAAATNPTLLKSIAHQLQLLHARIENDQIDPMVSTIIRLVADGMYFNQLYGMNLEQGTRDKVLHHLIALTGKESL